MLVLPSPKSHEYVSPDPVDKLENGIKIPGQFTVSDKKFATGCDIVITLGLMILSVHPCVSVIFRFIEYVPAEEYVC